MKVVVVYNKGVAARIAGATFIGGDLGVEVAALQTDSGTTVACGRIAVP